MTLHGPSREIMHHQVSTYIHLFFSYFSRPSSQPDCGSVHSKGINNTVTNA
jgi:hypothetical protein